MISGAGDESETHMCFGRCTRWSQKFATSIQNVADSFVSVIPITVVVRYRFNNPAHDSTGMSPHASVDTGMKHLLFGAIDRVRATQM